jgi:hypothetical protein
MKRNRPEEPDGIPLPKKQNVDGIETIELPGGVLTKIFDFLGSPILSRCSRVFIVALLGLNRCRYAGCGVESLKMTFCGRKEH